MLTIVLIQLSPNYAHQNARQLHLLQDHQGSVPVAPLMLQTRSLNPTRMAGEIPSFKLVETDTVYSFLDINPLSKGHALVIPKCTSTSYYAHAGDRARDLC